MFKFDGKKLQISVYHIQYPYKRNLTVKIPAALVRLPYIQQNSSTIQNYSLDSYFVYSREGNYLNFGAEHRKEKKPHMESRQHWRLQCQCSVQFNLSIFIYLLQATKPSQPSMAGPPTQPSQPSVAGPPIQPSQLGSPTQHSLASSVWQAHLQILAR